MMSDKEFERLEARLNTGLSTPADWFPLLKEVQELRAENKALKAELAELERLQNEQYAND